MRRNDIRSLLTDSDDPTLRTIAGEYPVPFDQEKLFERSYAKFQGFQEQSGVRRPLWRRTAFRISTSAACLILSVGLGVGVWAKQQKIETRPPQEPPATVCTQTTTQITTQTTTQTTMQTTTQTTAKTEARTTQAPAANPPIAATTQIQAATETHPELTAAAPVRSTAATTAAAVSTTPAWTAGTTAAAPVTTCTAVQTEYKGMLPQSQPVITETKDSQEPETTALQTTESRPAATDITGTRATLPAQTLPNYGNKEELMMKAKSLRHIRSVISAAATTAVMTTMPAVTTTASEITESLTEPAGVVTQYGDVNLDKSVSLSDLIQLQRYLLGQGDGLDYWMNADLCEDGVIDVYDLAILKKELIGDDIIGGTVTVKVVDMMTGEPLEQASVYLVGLNLDCAYELSQWEYDPSNPEDSVICGLPTDSSYTYMLELHNLPAGYGTEFGNWDQQYMFSFDEGEKDQEITLRVLNNNSERNVRIHVQDWSLVDHPETEDRSYYGMMCVTDKNGIPYYPSMHSEEVALPDGEYRVFMYPFEMPVQMLTPESTFTRELAKMHPDVTITDQSNGLEFAVRDGKMDREVQFDFGPRDNVTNHVTVTCTDAFTGEPLEGVELSLIASPNNDPWTVTTWTTDETGSKQLDDLVLTGYPGYHIHVDKVPEGYSGGFDQGIYFGYVNEYDSKIQFRFTPVSEEPNFSADIIKWEDQSIINDAATYEIWVVEGGDPTYMDSNNLPKHTKIMEGVKPGEKVALKDGEYFAYLDCNTYTDKGLASISALYPKGKRFFKAHNLSLQEFASDTARVNFTIKDGKPDRAVVFYLKDYDPADYEATAEDYAEWDEIYRQQMQPTEEPSDE